MGSSRVTFSILRKPRANGLDRVGARAIWTVVRDLQRSCFEVAAVNTERVAGWVVWSLAVVVPGGLILAALWFSFRAAKRRSALTSSERVSHASQFAGSANVLPKAM